MVFPRRMLTATAVTASALVVASCATLPRNNAPQALRTFDAVAEVPTEAGPEPDLEPDLLLRDFYTASGHPTGDFSTARAYLTSDAEPEWSPESGPLIVDRLYITAMAGGDGSERAFQVRGRLLGHLAPGGAYVPENAEYEATIVMNREDGQWRISSLPDEVVIERTELLNHFEPHDLFFFDESSRVLVPDRRWVYSSEQSLDTVLITMLMDGPSEKISPAVREAAPATAEFVGRTDGAYNFAGFQDFDAQERMRFGAQLTWTLSHADVPQPYEVTLDGTPVSEGYNELTPEDFADLNPRLGTMRAAPLYALSEGNLQKVATSEAEPVDSELGNIGNLASADINASGDAAAVRREGKKQVLYAGTVDGNITEIMSADSITRPSIAREGTSAWAVADGDRIIRVVRSSSSGEFVQAEVDSSGLERIGGTISELQLSPTGARVAMLIDGGLYIGVIANPSAGVQSIVNVEQIATELGGSALSVEWNPDGSLLVGTAAPETPIWRVELDGSAATALPSGNISAPVVAVAASATTLYATDEHAVRQLATSGGAWRDVPGLRGVRSAPIVAN